jgi:hypothetical protein
VEEVAHVVERHDDHDDAAEEVEGLEARFDHYRLAREIGMSRNSGRRVDTRIGRSIVGKVTQEERSCKENRR